MTEEQEQALLSFINTDNLILVTFSHCVSFKGTPVALPGTAVSLKQIRSIFDKNASSNKHRLTYPRQLIQYRDFLKDGGEIYFKTDDDDLFRDSLTYFPASGYDIIWQTYDLHENEPEWNIRTEHEGMFTEMGIKIKALIARKKAGDDSVTWVEPKVLKKLAAQAEAEASAKAEGEGNV